MESRLRLIRRELKLTQDALAQRIGIGKSAISMIETGRSPLTLSHRISLVQLFNINPVWLETGNGKMFNHPTATEMQITGDASSLPLYRFDGMLDVATLLKDNAYASPTDYLHIPGMPVCDGAIQLSGIGDGMYPMLNNGDIVLYKQVYDLNDVFWGDMYLILISRGAEELCTLKYIQKSEMPNCIMLTSENPRYSALDIDIDKVAALALIKATIRINSTH